MRFASAVAARPLTAVGALTRASVFAAVWAGFYALYRGYYAAGGTAAMPGVPLSQEQFQYINAVAASALAVAAVLPLLLLGAWRTPAGRVAGLMLSFVIIVGCVGHALVGISQRVLSLTGMVTLSYPFWLTIDPATADWQALLWNEPWFLIEGLAWQAIAWLAVVREASWRRAWNLGVAVAVTVFTVMGVLSTFGLVGRVIVG